jgi:prefoldin subunit 5
VADDELKNLLANHAAETRRHFDVALERMEKRFDLLTGTASQIDEKLDRTAGHLGAEIQRGFAETQAMIKFSHAELDRRVRTLEESHRSLEETVADLAGRVQRLESSTH